MSFKILSCFVMAALLITITCEEVENVDRPEVLYILNPDTFPKVLTDSSSLLTRGERNNLVCTAAMCSNVCWALGFRFGRCNINRVCVCSNF